MKGFRINVGRNATPALVVSVTALLVVAVSLASGITGRVGVTDPRVRVETLAAEGSGVARGQRYQVMQSAMTGEVATTAERLREATALATAASLLVATELANRRAPANTGQLISALLDRRLLPGGFSATGWQGTLATPHGTLTLRYRGAPLSIEVISLGASRAAGPAILVRVPEEERGGQSGIWLAESLDEVVIPRPFAPAVEVIAAGWQPDALPPIR